MIKKVTALAACALSINAFAQINPSAEQKLQTFFKYVELAYVDTVDADELAEQAIVGILEELDPHSTYIPLDELQRMNEPLQGKFEGVGIQFNLLKDTITVVSPISGGPSEKLGIISGDKIITINGKTVAGVGFTNQDVMDNLRGEKGTKVNVGIKRGSTDDLIPFEITRDKIPIYSVDAAYMADPTTGYIKLNRFAATSMKEINVAMDSLQGKGMDNLILDLRGNGGGYLNIAIELADQFLKKGQLIVYTEGRSYPKDETFATAKGSFEKGKLVVLIDEGSASASEIVSGAVQDWDRALILGRRSFGKGLVQKPFSLPDGSQIRLTISRYYTPSGRSIQKPYEDGLEAYYNDLNTRYEHGEYTTLDSIHFPDSLKYETKLRGRPVYGGGGIMPDIFIPLDTTKASKYYSDLIRKGALSQFSLTYLDHHRNELKQSYPTIESFTKEFNVVDILPEFVAYAADETGIEKNEEEFIQSKSLIETSLKALIARGIYERGAFYQITNQTDETYQRALEVLKDDSYKRFNISH